MFSFRKRNKVPEETASLARKLTRTRSNLLGSLASLLQGRSIDEELLEDLEAHLLMADVGVEVTTAVMSALRKSVDAKRVDDAGAVRAELHRILVDILQPCEEPLVIADAKPFVILVTGVNGVGKTTTIGKIAQQLKQAGQSVLLAAGDTFRAAAVEQLAQWAERLDVPLVRQGTGADAASVIYDALQAAQARDVDCLVHGEGCVDKTVGIEMSDEVAKFEDGQLHPQFFGLVHDLKEKFLGVSAAFAGLLQAQQLLCP